MSIEEVGRMEQKFINFQRVRWLVVGAWGEISEDFIVLMEVISNMKKHKLEAMTGVHNRISVTAQLASLTSQNWQQQSRVCVPSQARLVLDRLEGPGGGAWEAAR